MACEMLVSLRPFHFTCGYGWTQSEYSGSCLRVYNYKKTWTEARTSCRAVGADLVKIIDSKMNAFVMTLLTPGEPAHIGLRRQDVMGKFRWRGEKHQADYLNFAKNREVNIEGLWCATLNNQNATPGQWTLVDCATTLKYLCEKSKNEKSPCINGWIKLTHEYCFKLFVEKKSWEDAQKSCLSEGGNLLRITDYQENQLISTKLSKEIKDPVFIGLRVIDKKPRWLDEEDFNWVNLFNFSPVLTEKEGDLCGHLNNSSVVAGTWALGSCTARHAYICEMDKDLCLDGWTPSAASGTCIKIHHVYVGPFKEARATCSSEGGDLVTILDEKMSQFITDQISYEGGHNYWIGLNDRLVPDQYRWLDFEEQVDFTNWGKDEPLDTQDKFGCTMIWQHDFEEDGKWASLSCELKGKAICEKYTDCENSEHGMLCPKECVNCSRTPGTKACNPRFGVCYRGCQAGYTCKTARQECTKGTYGLKCSKRCSPNCAGEDKLCDKVNGGCTMGCVAGYSGDLCLSQCQNGTYGLNCSENCSPNCAGDERACDHVNGTCTMGCAGGYKDPLCVSRSVQATSFWSSLRVKIIVAIVMMTTVGLLLILLCVLPEYYLEPEHFAEGHPPPPVSVSRNDCQHLLDNTHATESDPKLLTLVISLSTPDSEIVQQLGDKAGADNLPDLKTEDSEREPDADVFSSDNVQSTSMMSRGELNRCPITLCSPRFLEGRL